MLLGLLAFLAVPAVLMSSPSIAHAIGYAQEHSATVRAVQSVDQHRVLGFADGRLGRTECAGAEYRVSWPGGGGVVRHCWDDIEVAGMGDRWLIDPVTGQVARSSFDGWLRPGDSIDVVEAPRGNPVPLWEVTSGGAGDDFVRVGVMLALGSVAWWSAVRLGRRPARRRRPMVAPVPAEGVDPAAVAEGAESEAVVEVVEPPGVDEPAKPRLRGESKGRPKVATKAEVPADVADSEPQPEPQAKPKAKSQPAPKPKAKSQPKAASKPKAGAPTH